MLLVIFQQNCSTVTNVVKQTEIVPINAAQSSLRANYAWKRFVTQSLKLYIKKTGTEANHKKGPTTKGRNLRSKSPKWLEDSSSDKRKPSKFNWADKS